VFPHSSWQGSAEYTLVLTTLSGGTRMKLLKLIANKVGAGIRDQVSHRAGDVIALDVITQITGSDFELEITNNDSVSVNLNIIKIKS